MKMSASELRRRAHLHAGELILLAAMAMTPLPWAAAQAPASQNPPPLDAVLAPPAQKELLILGVFHFASSSDAYQQRVRFDVQSPERQREVERLVEALGRFKPTHIAVEALPERQRRLDSLFQAYIDGSYTLGDNEIYQLGFRLARSLGHPRVHAIDARMRGYTTYPQLQAELESLGQSELLRFDGDSMGKRYLELFQHDDSAKAVRPLIEHLSYLNSDARGRASMGSNLVALFRAGSDSLFTGPDWITQSFNRDLRIFRNLQRLAESGAERILLIVGASHVPLLQLLTESSPDFRSVPAHEYLR